MKNPYMTLSISTLKSLLKDPNQFKRFSFLAGRGAAKTTMVTETFREILEKERRKK